MEIVYFYYSNLGKIEILMEVNIEFNWEGTITTIIPYFLPQWTYYYYQWWVPIYPEFLA